MMVVRINWKTKEQIILRHEPHPKDDVALDRLAHMLAEYVMEQKGQSVAAESAPTIPV